VSTASAAATEALSLSLREALRLVEALAARLDASLEGTSPSRVALGSALAAAFGFRVASMLLDARRAVRRRGLLFVLFAALKRMPVVRGAVAREKRKLIDEMDADMTAKSLAAGVPAKLASLPPSGHPVQWVLREAERRGEKDATWRPSNSQMSGAVYVADEKHFEMCSAVYARFAHSNPLHADAFPATARFEQEVVNMAAHMLGGGVGEGRNQHVCGLMTSGGTESILTAIRATRDYMRETRGIRKPEMIVAYSAHAAVYKAAEYFDITLVRVGVDKRTMRMDVDATRRAVTKNTIMIYASAPGYPHGAMDDVESLARIAVEKKTGLHVDACLGGFVMPFASEAMGEAFAKTHAKPFDFRVPGVTSMSVDTHKYGLAQKGSSVVLYASPALRQYQYTAVMDWSGGLYISPSQAGSRSGGLIAQTWAAMVHVGREGYVERARDVLVGAAALRDAVDAIDGLETMGADVTMVVAWRSTDKEVDVYVLNDVMTKNGWHLSVLHAPPALHYCVTPANVRSVAELAKALAAATAETRALSRGGEKGVAGGKAPIYGLAGGLPDRGLIGDILKDVQDLMLKNA
jgi:sphinganine-1-phosphate aldolase